MQSKIKSFRDLIVWQKAKDLSIILYSGTNQFPREEVYGLTSQMRRAAISISSNIAEGFKRNSNKEKIQFYTTAYGSLAELESQVEISHDLKYLPDQSYNNIIDSINETARLLDGILARTQSSHPGRFSRNTSLGIVAVFIPVFYVLSSVFPISTAVAGEIGLAVTKNRFEIEMLAGDTYGGDLVVFNQSAEAAVPVHVELSLWNLKEDSDDIEFVQAEPLLNATKWFEVATKDFILDKGSDRKIQFQINAPKEAPLGAYLAMMRIQAVLPEHYFLEQGPRFLPELGVLFFINLKTLAMESAEENSRLNILSFQPEGTHLSFVERYLIRSANAGVFDEAVKKLVAKVENKSTYYFKASGFVVIKNLFGQTVALVKIPERFLLPNRTRSIPITVITPSTEQSKFNILYSIFNLLQQQSYLGPYTATLTLNVPSGDGEVRPISETINFWVIPWKFWSVVLMSSILSAFVVFKIGKRIKPAFFALMGR